MLQKIIPNNGRVVNILDANRHLLVGNEARTVNGSASTSTI